MEIYHEMDYFCGLYEDTVVEDGIDKSGSDSDDVNEWNCWSVFSQEGQCVDRIYAMRDANGDTFDFEFGYRNSNETRMFSNNDEDS
jgi:hypothetical protein